MHNDSYISHSKIRGVANRFLTVVGLVLLVVLGARAQSQLRDPAMVQGKPRIDASRYGTGTAADLLAFGSRGLSPLSIVQNEHKVTASDSKPPEAVKETKFDESKVTDKAPAVGRENANKKQPPAVTASTSAIKTAEQSKRP